MKIETKFNIGDKVWALANNKALFQPITRIDCQVMSNSSLKIEYNIYDFWIDEKYIFATKEELLASL